MRYSILSPAVGGLPPDAEGLVLVGQVLVAGEVEGLDIAGLGRGAGEVLGAALGGQHLGVAAVLGGLERDTRVIELVVHFFATDGAARP